MEELRLKKAVMGFEYLYPYLYLYLYQFKIYKKKDYHFKLEIFKKWRAFLDGKMICLFQLTLEGRSIIFPIHDVYNKCVHCSCSPGLGGCSYPPTATFRDPHSSSENWKSRTELGAELPPPTPPKQTKQ